MKLRAAKRGRNAGGFFWGCNDFPNCRGIQDYTGLSGKQDPSPMQEESSLPTSPAGSAPLCPECNSEMVMKIAGRGRNAGRRFWTCRRFPECRGKREYVEDTGEVLPSPLTSPARKCMRWTDATTNRLGWTCRYTTAGASLRSFNASRKIAERISQCWIARTQAIPSATSDAERVAGLLQKILQRGSTPPIDPRSESRLLDMLGLGTRISPALLPGDLSVRLQQRLDTKQLEVATWWQNPKFELDPNIALGSEAEEQFIKEWLPKRIAPVLARWFIPQAPLDTLANSRGISVDGQRRIDFLAIRRDASILAIEIDGRQHDDAELVDKDRDALFASSDVPFVRIPVDELRAGKGIGLNKVIDFYADEKDTTAEDMYVRLVWAPSQAHRLMLALIEALKSGMLSGARWIIEVDDPLDVAIELFEPYLDLILAVDRIWAGNAVANEILLGSLGNWRRYVATNTGFMRTEATAKPEIVNLLVRLESDRASTDRLEQRANGPEIVVRSAWLPIDVFSDPVTDGSGRIPVCCIGDKAKWALRVVLQSVFAKEDFLEGQFDALFEVINQRDCAVLLPTGAGKSLIYQLAGLVMPGRTLIVDPLIALMEDQVEGLGTYGIDRVVAISTFTVAQGQGDSLLDQVRSGYALFIFVTPERLQQRSFRDALRGLSAMNILINLTVVDEAHCISEWGHDFRTSYLNLGKTLRTVCQDMLGKAPPILALTGTASRTVLRDVLIELAIERDSERSVVRPHSFDRKELRFNIVRAEPANAHAMLAGFVRGLPARFGVSPSEFFSSRGDSTYSGIIFCPHANGKYGVEEVRRQLATVTGFVPAMYAGKAPNGYVNEWDKLKRKYATLFKSNEAPLLVSTKAFGMGIDKPNIRYVVHFGIPGSIEGYYQEVGRAGRDRFRAECGLVLVEYDEQRDRRLLADDVDIEDARSEPEPSFDDKDDIDRQLYLHFCSFSGVEDEFGMVGEVLGELSELGKRRSNKLPMGADEEVKAQRERALHRLVVLGVIREYLVEWGGRKFIVELENVKSADVANHLVNYVLRNQPARAEIIHQQVNSVAARSLREAVIECSRLLIEFIYDTVERARRRSLREMWLAARESIADPNGVFRQRILDYLTQGAIAPTLERLVDRPSFDFADWIEELTKIDVADDAREMRGDSARLLSSYPDHPGLLLARGLSEVLDDRGNLKEFASNLAASLENSSVRYNVDVKTLEVFANWLFTYCINKREGALPVAISVFEKKGIALSAVADIERRSLCESGFNAAVRVLALASALEKQNIKLTTVINHYKGARL